MQQEQVLGLQISMNHAPVVCGREAPCDLHGDIDPLANRQGTLRGQPIAQRLALEQFGDGVEKRTGSRGFCGLALALADVVDRENVRM